jgi:hypothetical protein
MTVLRFCLAAALLGGAAVPARAVEGPTAAGPIGGTDMRSGLLPPPGVYFGTMQLAARTMDFVDGNGRTIPGLEDAQLSKGVGGPFLYYVPETKIFGGHVALAGILPIVYQCGHLFADQSRQCDTGAGDPYVEIAWSRYFGAPRPSAYAGAYPILEGLSILIGFGVVVPTGKFTAADPLRQALSAGTNIWDFAPTMAVTYTTRPILAEGTEFSAKLYWNTYLENPETDYHTGDVLNLDFAVTEHIGRFQAGIAGFYATQIADDKIAGARIPPDGRRGTVLQIGGVVGYDMPEHGSSFKVKALVAPYAENTVTSWGVTFGWIKKY